MNTPPYKLGSQDDGSVISVIRIDYQKSTEAPSRIFRSAAELIDAFYAVERDLAKSINADIAPVILLEEIQSGSILVWLKTVLQNTSDDALLNLDWKPLVGQFLVKGKHRLLEFLDGKDNINDPSEISVLQNELLQLNPAPEVARLPLPEVVPAKRLLNDCKQIADALSHLRPTDNVIFESENGEVEMNKGFKITSEEIERILTRREEEIEAEMCLKVKKPDYLGSSRWEFKHNDRTLEAKIEDLDWLYMFQSRISDVRPGDSINARVRITIKRDQNDLVVAERYTITHVISTIQSSSSFQLGFLPGDDHDEERS
jgi:hypothetical protein